MNIQAKKEIFFFVVNTAEEKENIVFIGNHKSTLNKLHHFCSN